MKRITLYALLFCSSLPLFSFSDTDPVKALIEDFVSTDWPRVSAAKGQLENLGASAIPEIINLLTNCNNQKLQHTGDLIYPGAEKVYGHGQMIEYDIDVICVRAGWLLEDLTFCNFGFSGIQLPGNELDIFIKSTFSAYYNQPGNPQKISALSEDEKRMLIRSKSIEKAKAWWPEASKQWTRLSALQQALSGTDEISQVKALFYLRNGRSQCTGLTQKYYKLKLAGIVERLTKSKTDRISENAKLIMLDSDFSWLALKLVD